MRRLQTVFSKIVTWDVLKVETNVQLWTDVCGKDVACGTLSVHDRGMGRRMNQLDKWAASSDALAELSFDYEGARCNASVVQFLAAWECQQCINRC